MVMAIVVLMIMMTMMMMLKMAVSTLVEGMTFQQQCRLRSFTKGTCELHDSGCLPAKL